MTPEVDAVFDTATNTVSYLVADPASRIAAVIDPVLDFDVRSGAIATTSADWIIAAAAEKGLTIAWVLETHAHADHLSAADHIRRRTGARVAIGSRITDVQATFGPLVGAEDLAPDGGAFDILLEEGDVIAIGGLEARVMHTPGHTPACVTYVIGDAAFVGDTLFMPDFGTARCDFPGGDAATLYRSVQRILALPDETRIFVGHDYLVPGRTEFRWQTAVAEQRAANIHVRAGTDEAVYVAMRRARDATLPPPALLYPALQVNIRAGALPPADAAGRVFLKLPVSAASPHP
jgi:glyoxylase-like metal-dependent hydrolase (beta-lactamase superfamily II)